MAFATLDYYYAKKPIPSMTSTPPNVHPLAKHIKERLYDSLGLKFDPSQIYHYGCGAICRRGYYSYYSSLSLSPSSSSSASLSSDSENSLLLTS